MAQGEQVIGIDDQNRGIARQDRGITAESLVADPSGLTHSMQSNVQQRGTDHPALGSSLSRGGEPTFLDHTRLQPFGDRSPPGKGTQ